jgi:hypothetical protein
MSDLLPQLIVLALGGAIAPPLLLLTIAPPHHLVLGFSILGFSKASLPNATALGLGYFAVLRGDEYLRANPLRRGGQSEGTRGREEVSQGRER